MKDFFVKFIKNPIVVNLIVAGVLSLVLLFGVLKWLEIYTHHNQAVIIPDLKGKEVEQAELLLNNNKLRHNVIDSVFAKDVSPGSVVEVTPKVGSKVKEGRIVFITINARTAQMADVPEVEDLSFRQAYALLKSRGFNSIETEYVPGDYKDLAIAVEINGKVIAPGEKIPLSSALILKVSSGEVEMDSLSVDMLPVERLNSEEEKWF